LDRGIRKAVISVIFIVGGVEWRLEITVNVPDFAAE
jgi:hypothetical protein